ncbi:MAG: hypothetical protein ACHQIM_18985 [Sphingobacteriales bacterium]
MRSFFLKINIRQLIIQFIASWFSIYAFDTLFSLYDYSFYYHTNEFMGAAIKVQRFNRDTLILTEGGSLGLVIAYIVTWQTSVKRNWYWVNAVFVFMVAFGLKSQDWLGWRYLMKVFLAPGRLIFDDKTIPCVLVNALVMLGLGSLLLFSDSVKRFIDKGNHNGVKPAPVKRKKA